MKVQKEFSHNAPTYSRYNIIQTRVIEAMIERLGDEKPTSVLDIGCGRGGVYEAIDWPLEHFVGIDFALGMLALHPSNPEVELLECDFNNPRCLENLPAHSYDRIFSASALQWADDLDDTLKRIAALQIPATLAIFTAGTFATLHATAGTPALLRPAQEVMDLSARHFSGSCERLTFRLDFHNVREMFRYLKRSGVSGGRTMLSVPQMRALMRDYPFGYLEFEVVLTHESTVHK